MGYPANVIFTSVSGCCFILHSFISPFMSLVHASAFRLLFLPFILLSSLPFLHKKNTDKEFRDTAQFQCRPEGGNIQFNSTVVISRMSETAVGVQVCYGLDGPGIKSRCARIFLQPSRLNVGHKQPPVKLVPCLLPGIRRPGRGVNRHPSLASRLKKE